MSRRPPRPVPAYVLKLIENQIVRGVDEATAAAELALHCGSKAIREAAIERWRVASELIGGR